ncbi:MAG: hypothetical protein ACP5MH_10495 [Thermoproteus sp.]
MSLTTQQNCIRVSMCQGTCVSFCGTQQGYCICQTAAAQTPTPTSTGIAIAADMSSMINMLINIIPLILIISVFKDLFSGSGGCKQE